MWKGEESEEEVVVLEAVLEDNDGKGVGEKTERTDNQLAW